MTKYKSQSAKGLRIESAAPSLGARSVRAKYSTSAFPSPVNTKWVVTGPTATDVLVEVLRRAWCEPPTVSCDFARRHAPYIAMAACKGLITTRISSAVYGRRWLITAAGMRMINESENTE